MCKLDKRILLLWPGSWSSCSTPSPCSRGASSSLSPDSWSSCSPSLPCSRGCSSSSLLASWLFVSQFLEFLLTIIAVQGLAPARHRGLPGCCRPILSVLVAHHHCLAHGVPGHYRWLPGRCRPILGVLDGHCRLLSHCGLVHGVPDCHCWLPACGCTGLVEQWNVHPHYLPYESELNIFVTFSKSITLFNCIAWSCNVYLKNEI